MSRKPGTHGRRRDRRLLLFSGSLVLFSFLCGATSVCASEPVEIIDTWTAQGLAGWTNGSSRVELSNPGGYLNMKFKSQSVPSLVFDIAWRPIGPGIVLTNLSYRFFAFDVSPSAVRLYLHSVESGNSWYVSMSTPSAGSWTYLTVPVDYSAGWTKGPDSSEEQFLRDMNSIDCVGVYVRRHADVRAQNYGADDFIMQGHTAEQVVDPPADTDNDGLPDEWESLHGLNPDDPMDSGLDSDGDGMCNFAEYLAGTDPNDDDSQFEVEIGIATQVKEMRGIMLKWRSVTNRLYSILRADNLTGGFTKIEANIPGTPPVNVYVDVAATNKGPYFYKIAVEQ